MNKYTRMNWENTPSTATPLTADNLNHMDEGIERATDGAIALETEITTARGSHDSLGARLDTTDANLAKKADKTSTLAGYGIVNAYTKTEMLNFLAKKEDNLNKVSSKTDITDSSTNYPSIKYLNDFYYDASKSYSAEETDELLGNKADVNSVYSKVETDNFLRNKADKADVDTSLANKANLVNSSNIFDFDAWAKEWQKSTSPVYHGTLDELNFDEKSFTITPTGHDTYTNSWQSQYAKKISVKPNTKYLICWLTNNSSSKALVFLNGITTNNVTIQGGKGTFVTNNDTSFITLRFGTYSNSTFKISKIMITEKESIYLPNIVAEGVPEVANEVLAFEKTTQTSLDGKYDSSNVEVGKGELTPAQATYDGCEGSFNYSKIGKTVTVALNITTLIAGKDYVQFTGLPFKAMTASRLSSIAVYTTANKLVNIRFDGSWLFISSPGTTFAEGEKINVIVTYIIG